MVKRTKNGYEYVDGSIIECDWCDKQATHRTHDDEGDEVFTCADHYKREVQRLA
jgi:hypothetical protein